MIYLFTDIDGVLACLEDTIHGEKLEFTLQNEKKAEFYLLNPGQVEVLDYLMSKYRIQLVLSSSWRLAKFAEPKDIFVAAGCKTDTWQCKEVHVTPTDTINRWVAISRYCLLNKVKRFVVLDDEEPPKSWLRNLKKSEKEIGFFILTRDIEPDSVLWGLKQERAKVERVLMYLSVLEKGNDF
jgi:hypothetical protein